MTIFIVSILIFFLFVSTILILGVLFLNRYVNDAEVRSIEKQPFSNSIQKVLAIFAHPDDEVMVAGTLAKFKDAGIETHLLYLTHGEDGPTGGLVSQEELGKRRAIELKQVGQILQVNSLEVLNFPDRYLNQVATNEIIAEIKKRFDRIQPDTVICFDQTIGLYGNSDHVVSGRVVYELAYSSGVKNLLIMTLPTPMIELALKVSKTFKERYDTQNGLPPANGCIKIRGYSKQKKEVIKAHQTQKEVMNDVQPLWDKVPYWIYYRIFSREYFNCVVSTEYDGGLDERA